MAFWDYLLIPLTRTGVSVAVRLSLLRRFSLEVTLLDLTSASAFSASGFFSLVQLLGFLSRHLTRWERAGVSSF